MGAQDERAAKTVAVIVHHFIVMSATAGLVCLLADIILHISRTENKRQRMLLRLTLQYTKRALVPGFHRLHQWERGNTSFHHSKNLLNSNFIVVEIPAYVPENR